MRSARYASKNAMDTGHGLKPSSWTGTSTGSGLQALGLGPWDFGRRAQRGLKISDTAPRSRGSCFTQLHAKSALSLSHDDK